MNQVIQQLFQQTFDVETFAHRLVLRCAVAAQAAVAEGKDPYTEVMAKYGGTTYVENKPEANELI